MTEQKGHPQGKILSSKSRRSKGDKSPKKMINLFIIYFLVFILLIIVLGPAYWMLVTSLKSNSEILAAPPTFFPVKPIIDNYLALFDTGFLSMSATHW